MGILSGFNPFASIGPALRGASGLGQFLGGGGTGGEGSVPPTVAPPPEILQPPTTTRQGPMKTTSGGEVEAYIRQAAVARGMDPDKVMDVVLTEGGPESLRDPFRQSRVPIKNKQGQVIGYERSYGPLQLFIDGGVGNRAIASGKDPRKDWRGGIDVGLDVAAEDGSWKQWYGPQNAGLPLDWGLPGSKALARHGASASAGRAPAAIAGIGSPTDLSLMPTAPHASPTASFDVAAGTQTLPVSGGRSGGTGGASGGIQSEETLPPDQQTPVGRAFQQWKVNRTTRMLRGLGVAPTLGVLTAIGTDIRGLGQKMKQPS